MFRTVLVHTDFARFAADRVAAAVDVARSFDATLLGITAGVPHLPYEVYSTALGTVGLGPDYSDLDREKLEAEFAKTKEAFDLATRKSGVETEWEAVFDAPSRAIARAAVGADIVVLGAGDNSLLGNETMASSGEVLLRAGRPVLLVPEGCRTMKPATVLIAWKEGPEAQRAIADALPFLKRATRVIVAEVEEEPGQASPSLARAGAFLVRHGIAARTEHLKREASIPAQLTGYAKSIGADLIVAGAYGHTRLREWIFGGVTRELLTATPVPCLLSH